jgi:purine-binding chemotaxis protein CheW
MATTTTVEKTAESQDIASLGGKYLTFFLGKEEYGLMILKVQEIFGMMPITPVPRMPDHTLGVINLRGKVIPVMDLRRRFGMAPEAVTEQTCIIVVHSDSLQMGVLVDKVSEVLDIDGGDIEEPPAMGSGVTSNFILGIGKADNGVKLLLDIDKVLAEGDEE